MDPLTIIYATDNGYAQHVAVSLYSLYNSAKTPESYRVIILDNNLTELHRSRLIETAAKYNQTLSFVSISDIGSRLPENIDIANLSISTYSRLFIAQLISDAIDEVLYLDCDTYIHGDLLTIRDFIPKNEEWYVAGVEDTMYPYMKESIGLDHDSLYLNAGILLINVKRWRENNIIDKFLEFIDSHKGAVPHLDQGVINGVFKDGKIRLPLRYNVQAPVFAIHHRKDMMDFFSLPDFYDDNTITEAKKHPVVVHYTSFFLERPWFRFSLHPYKDWYRNTLKKTPYAEIRLQKNKIGIVGFIKDMCFKYLQPIYLKIR